MKNTNKNLSFRITHHSSSRYSPYGRMRDIVVGYVNAPLYPGLQISGMTNGAGGFTLIELLVVVLIIGILAAVALPQYQKAVEKSKATQALTLLKTTADAFQAHHMATGEWASSFDELSIDIPWTGRDNFINTVTDARSNGEWSVGIEHSNLGYITLMAGRISGKYKGANFAVVFVNPDGLVENPTMRCAERISSGSPFPFDPSLPAGAFCEKIMKGTFLSQSQWARGYSLP